MKWLRWLRWPKRDKDGAIVYKIKKGRHYSWPRWIVPFRAASITFSVTFTKSCQYEPSTLDLAWDINKAFGFKEDLFGENSARLGWRMLGGRTIGLFAYTHSDGIVEGKVNIRNLGYLEAGGTVICTIKCSKEEYYFEVRTPNNTFKQWCKRSAVLGAGAAGTKYLQFPYFGGNSKAPHDMEFAIKILSYD